jgi:hypothetical protein
MFSPNNQAASLVDSPVVVAGWYDLSGTAGHGLVDEGSQTCTLTLQALQHLAHLTSVQFTSRLSIAMLSTVLVRQGDLYKIREASHSN